MNPAGTLGEVADLVATCTACPLAGTRTQAVPGSGPAEARLVLVGEAPGAAEDHGGQPFVGRSGSLLLELLGREVGLDRSEVFITNTVKCRPPGNRDPRAQEIAACRGHLVAQLAALAPTCELVVTVGNVATRAVLGTTEGIMALRGVPRRVEGWPMPVLATIHPAAALRGGSAARALLAEDLATAGRLLGGHAA